MPLSDLIQQLRQPGQGLAGPPRLTADQVMVVLLDEIAGRLADIADQQNRLAAGGELVSFQDTAGTTWAGGYAGWKIATVFNDGTADVYLRTNYNEDKSPPTTRDAPLKSGESLRLTCDKGELKALHHITLTGNATLRIFLNK